MDNRGIYLFRHGLETQADARSLTPLLAEQALKVYPFPPPPAIAAPNVGLQRLNAPPIGAGGEALPVSVTLENTNPIPVRGELTVRQGEKVAWQQEVTLAPGTSLL